MIFLQSSPPLNALRSEQKMLNALRMIQFIGCLGDKEKDVKKFEEECLKIPGYSLSDCIANGQHALFAAISQRHMPLIRHLGSKGSIKLLNLGDCNDWTPLFYATFRNKFKEKNFQIVKELVRLGAGVNSATSQDVKVGTQIAPKGASPLWAAANKAKSLKLVAYLIKQGAVATPELKGEAKVLADKGVEEINKGLIAMNGFYSPASPFRSLPWEIIRMIAALHLRTD